MILLMGGLSVIVVFNMVVVYIFLFSFKFLKFLLDKEIIELLLSFLHFFFILRIINLKKKSMLLASFNLIVVFRSYYSR
jgi:hypothetical protein